MTKTNLLYLFLCCAMFTSAQDDPKERNYFVLKVGPSFLFTGTKTGMEQVSFPYSVKPVGGSPSDSSFVSHPFSPLRSMQTAIFMTLELGNDDHFFGIDIGGYTSADNGFFVSFGYGRNIYVSLFQHHDTRLPTESNFVIKPSFHIGYNGFNNTIAKFDNLNKYVSIGSYTSGPTFSQSTFDFNDLTSSSKTYATQSLAISYLQRSCTLSAEVAFGNNPYKHIFHWEIVAGVYLSATEAIGVKFNQEATDGTTQQSSSFYPIGTNGTSATFNGNSITTAPFRFTGFKIGFNVGISTCPERNRNVFSNRK